MIQETSEQTLKYYLTNGLNDIEQSIDSVAAQINNGNETLHSVLDSVPSISADIHAYVDHSINDTFLWIPVNIAQFIIPAVITVFLSFVGYWINKKQERDRQNSEGIRKQERKLASLKADCVAIMEYVRALDASIRKTCISIYAFTSFLKDSHTIELEALNLGKISVECLKQFDLLTLSRMYITNRKGDDKDKANHLYDVISSIEYLSKVESILNKHYEDYKEQTMDYIRKWNEAYEKLVAYLSDTEFRTRKKDTFVKFCDLLSKEDKDGDKYIDPQTLTNEVFKPFKEWLREKYDLNDYDARTIDSLLHQIIYIYDKEKTPCFYRIADVFNDVAAHILSAYEDLSRSLNKLDANEFVDIRDIE